MSAITRWVAFIGAAVSIGVTLWFQFGEATPSEDVPANQAHPSAPVAILADVEPARAAHLSGVVQDELGSPLPWHIVELVWNRLEASGQRAAEVDVSVVTDHNGRFRFDGLESGTRELVVRGPGDGDVWARPGESTSLLGVDAAHESIERVPTIGVPATGMDGLVVVARGHQDVLVTACLVDDLGRPVRSGSFWWSGGDRRDSAFIDEFGNFRGVVMVLEPRESELTHSRWSVPSFRHLEAMDPLIHAAFMPISINLTDSARQLDLGTVMLSRMAGLAVTLADSSNSQLIEDATVRMVCSGGDRPATEVEAKVNDEGCYVLWSGRSYGSYELSIDAPGYLPASETGTLSADDRPQPLDVFLKRKERTQ